MLVITPYNMENYLTGTLFSLSKYYQNLEDYEVLTINNGGEKINENFFYKFGRNFKYKYIEKSDADVHPYIEINKTIEKTHHDKIVIICDGARICSKNILDDYIKILNKSEFDICTCPSYHLGFDLQRKSILSGYNSKFEDNILKRSRWWLEGSSIFDISVLGGSSDSNLYKKLQVESNCLGISKKFFLEIGGFSKNFKIPGGGQINIEFFQKLVSNKKTKINYFINHGTFHQLHGGMSTNSKDFKKQKKNENEELKNINLKIDLEKIKNKKFNIIFNGPKRKIISKDNYINIISFLKGMDEFPYSKPAEPFGEMISNFFYKIKVYLLLKKMKLRIFLQKIKLNIVVMFIDLFLKLKVKCIFKINIIFLHINLICFSFK